jgi:hypothetical protein
MELVTSQQEKAGLDPRPWEGLPPDAVKTLGPRVPALAGDIIDAVRREIPEYSQPLEGAFGQTVQRAVEEALSQFMAMTREPGLGRTVGRDLYVALGRGEARDGRPLELLLTAYRIGARVAWRRIAAIGIESAIAPETLVLIAESIFAYIDELSAESAEGYTSEQAERVGEADRLRQVVLARLLQSPPAGRASLRAAAEEARWRLPRRVAVAVWQGEDGRRPAARLPGGSLAARHEGQWCAVVPDPQGPGRMDATRAALEGVPGGVGPGVDVGAAAESFRLARQALELANERGATEPALVEERRVDLILRAEAGLVESLARERLAPLANETLLSRSRLAATLLAWLRHGGDVRATADELFVHPQTVRYRLGRLRDLFGHALDDPDARFELELVLRAEGGEA